MGNCVLICGLNGAGKTTLARALAVKTGLYHIDSEQLYFDGSDHRQPRSSDEAIARLNDLIDTHDALLFSAVRGEYGEKLKKAVKCAVLVETPRDIRLERIRARSLAVNGDRILPGGDMYESEERFFARCGARPEDYVTSWLETLPCPVIRADGTLPPDKNAETIAAEIAKMLL